MHDLDKKKLNSHEVNNFGREQRREGLFQTT